MDDKVYYCDICAMQHRLPLRAGELIGGYCRLCGVASVYVGYITVKDVVNRGIHLHEDCALYARDKEHISKKLTKGQI